MVTLQAMREAQERLRGIIKPTPLQSSQTFSKMTGAEIFLKPESLQKAGSFKLRPAYNVLSSLSPQERARGLITYSAGNWAQGVALAASMLEVKATVVMPEAAPKVKVQATQGYGAEVILYGTNSVELLTKAQQIELEREYFFLDRLGMTEGIIGNATIGLEIMAEMPDVDAIVAPVGGGSLFAGIAAGAKAVNHRVQMIGVQPIGANAMKLSLETGRVVEIDSVATIADGLAVKRPSEFVFHLIKDLIDEIVLVSDDDIVGATLLLLERAKLLVEPSGATALAGVISGKVNVRGKKVAVVLSGGNLDPKRLATFLMSGSI